MCLAASGVALAGESKIATISIQDILASCKAGQGAQKVLEEKMVGLQAKLQKEKDALDELKKEMDKKNSVWSAEVKAEKERDFQKRLREAQLKEEDAKYEMSQLEKKVMEPILKDLHEIIGQVGKREGYTVILEYTMKGLHSRSGLLYADEAIDISDMVRKELDARQAKAK